MSIEFVISSSQSNVQSMTNTIPHNLKRVTLDTYCDAALGFTGAIYKPSCTQNRHGLLTSPSIQFISDAGPAAPGGDRHI